ncbi:hypothetical protein [Streptosporangium sp. NPDC003464]
MLAERERPDRGEFELRGGHDAGARVERAVHGLGPGHGGRDRGVGGLSGRHAGGSDIRRQVLASREA